MAHGLTKLDIMIGSFLFVVFLGVAFCVDQTALNLNTQTAAFSYTNSQLQNNQKTNLNIPNPSGRPNVTPSPISLSYSGSVVRNDNRQRPTGQTIGSVQPPVSLQARPGNVQLVNTQTVTPTISNPPVNPRPGQSNPSASQYPALPSQQPSRIQPPTPPVNPPRQNNPFPALPGQNPGRVQTLVNTFSGSPATPNVPTTNPQNRPIVQPGRVQSLINTYSGQAGSKNGANTPSPLTGGSRPFSYSGALKGTQPGASPLPSPLPAATGSNIRSPSAVDPKEPVEPGATTDTELGELSEDLLRKDVNNAAKYLTINYQSKTTSRALTDEAPLPLLTVNQSAYEITTIAKLRPLFNNYILETDTNEHVTAQERNEENALLDAVLATSVMRHLMTFLQQKGKVTLDPKSHKDLLKGIWFNLYSRGGGKIGSSAFEHVFLSELKRGEISGLHNWVYFSEEEMANLINYMGYMKKVELGQKGSILKLRFNRGTVSKPVNSMFIGTSPELEMALYTACFVLRPDAACPVVLAGNPVTIRTHNFRYRGKNMIGSAFPEI